MKSGQTVTIDALSHEEFSRIKGAILSNTSVAKAFPRRTLLEDAIAVAAGIQPNRTKLRQGRTARCHRPGPSSKAPSLETYSRSRLSKPFPACRTALCRADTARALSPSQQTEPLQRESLWTKSCRGRHRRARNKGPVEVRRCFHFHGDRRRQGRDAFRTVEGAVSLRPFMGMMGVAYSADADPTSRRRTPFLRPWAAETSTQASRCRIQPSICRYSLKAPSSTSVTPTWPWVDGEAALTAMEGSLRGTFRTQRVQEGFR